MNNTDKHRGLVARQQIFCVSSFKTPTSFQYVSISVVYAFRMHDGLSLREWTLDSQWKGWIASWSYGCIRIDTDVCLTEWASKSIKSSVATSQRRLSLPQKSTACASLLPMRSSPSHASGTSLGEPVFSSSQTQNKPSGLGN